jgi:hypothetical protein
MQPKLGALSKFLDLNTLRSVKNCAGIGTQNIVVSTSDPANGAHRFDGRFDFRISGHGALR